ncbi:MAG: class I SAM-dependent methyltransferase [Desulfobulbaceae bacterium]|nr:class I SAM-dependent methyltransferase [Desulfobulbaceae bacterium]
MQHYPQGLAGKKLLDIGCATGFLMQEARSQGAEVAGIDVNIWATEQAQKLLPGAKIFPGDLSDSLAENFFAAESFDIVTATDVIEHIAEIKPFLRDILRLLAPEGSAIFTLPDPDSFSARAMGNAWFQYKAEHVTYLSRKSLTLLAAELGFQIEQIKPHRKILTLEYLANVLTYHNQGWLSKLGWLTGKVARLSGLARIPLTIGTGEMLVKINQKPAGN